MTKGVKSDFCGICDAAKVERNGRLVCMACNRRYANNAAKRRGPIPSTVKIRATKAKYRNKVRATGLTNQKVNALRHRYGLSEVAYLTLLAQQSNQCAICLAHLDKEALVDHNHVTFEVRGLLCRRCNFGIGLFKDDITVLRNAANYIEVHLNDQDTTL